MEIHVVQLIRDAAAARVLKHVGARQVVLDAGQFLGLRRFGLQAIDLGRISLIDGPSPSS